MSYFFQTQKKIEYLLDDWDFVIIFFLQILLIFFLFFFKKCVYKFKRELLFWFKFDFVISYLIFKKKNCFFFLKQIFSILVYIQYVFLRLIRFILHIKIFEKFIIIFYNFNFMFLLIFANTYRIKLIIFYIFNQNYDFAYYNWF